MALMGFDATTRRMYVKGLYPGISPDQVLDRCGFDIDITRASEVEAPSTKELTILRDNCDPQKLILK
jgi:glutaconate CoA-transferase subunit B